MLIDRPVNMCNYTVYRKNGKYLELRRKKNKRSTLSARENAK